MNENFSTRMNFPYLLGVEIAVNAISDAHIIMDASDCIMAMPEFIKNHDLNSTMLDAGGFHRIFHTNADVHSVAGNRTKEISDSIKQMLESGRVKTLFVSPTPMTIITGYQYDKIIRDLGATDEIAVIDLVRKGLLGDWLDGYADTLEAVAKHAVFSGDGGPNSCIVVGNFMDRTEEDNLGNVRELKRMLSSGLGLDTLSIWLDGSSIDRLMHGRRPTYVISLPYARRAAEILSEKAGAKLIEADMPVGLDGSRTWLMNISELINERDRAEKFVKGELSILAPKLQWAVPKYFMGKRVIYCGDPYMAAGIKKLVEEVGCSFQCAAVFANPEKGAGDSETAARSEMRTAGFTEFIRSNRSSTGADIYIANSIAAKEIRVALGENPPIMEFGFPSYNYHSLYDSPYLGLRGAMSLYNRMAELCS